MVAFGLVFWAGLGVAMDQWSASHPNGACPKAARRPPSAWQCPGAVPNHGKSSLKRPLGDFPYGASPDCSVPRQDWGWSGLSSHSPIHMAVHPANSQNHTQCIVWVGSADTQELARLEQPEAARSRHPHSGPCLIAPNMYNNFLTYFSASVYYAF